MALASAAVDASIAAAAIPLSQVRRDIFRCVDMNSLLSDANAPPEEPRRKIGCLRPAALSQIKPRLTPRAALLATQTGRQEGVGFSGALFFCTLNLDGTQG